ncbi:MAG: 4Fe-4S binding protein [Bacteroidales bacterium]|jgi:ferredoxin|nr:4Fe-4S binding protein [Bacteroidales bacterium]
MQTYLKPVRIIISIVTLLVIGFLFLDFSDSVPVAWFRDILRLQFVPSLLSFLNTLGNGLFLSACGFVAILLLTLLFGRVYCSYICPLGVFQDIIIWISRKSKKKVKARYRFTPPKTWLRYGILIIVCLSLFTGSIFLVEILDPYSNFGRFISDFFRPVYVLGNNLLANILQKMGFYALYPVEIAIGDPYALIVPALLLLLVLWCAIRKGRLYCNAFCPVGTLLGLASYGSLFKIRIKKSSCTQCGKCMFACKSHCIDVKQQRIDFSRCVGCADCIKVCDQNSIRYSLTSDKAKKMAPDKSKRRFLFGSLLFMGALSGLSVKSLARNNRMSDEDAVEPEHNNGHEDAIKENQVCPPGSQSIHHFTGACTACHLCVSACPTGVLKPSLFEWGFFGMLQPYMDYHASFCNYECTKCSDVCPTNAILPFVPQEEDAQTHLQKSLEECTPEESEFLKSRLKIAVQIGTVRFIKNNCIVYTEETSCGSCSEHCPTKAVRMVPYKGELTIPQVNTNICVGCGACEYACPVKPNKAIIVDGCKDHQVAQKPPEDTIEEKPLEEFPF